jgi:hypothetical protein
MENDPILNFELKVKQQRFRYERNRRFLRYHVKKQHKGLN